MLQRYTYSMPSPRNRKSHYILAPIVLVSVLLLDALLSPAQAARKEFWHDLRHEFVSIDYVYGVYTSNDPIRLTQQNEEGPLAFSQNQPILAESTHRLGLDDVSTGWRFQLAFDFVSWMGVHINGSRLDRGIELRNLVSNGNQTAFGDDRFSGEVELLDFNYGLVFHTPGEIFSFDAAILYSVVSTNYQLRDTDLRLSNVGKGGQADNDRDGWFGWLGIRFRMGDRWETDLRFHQSYYNDRYDETSLVEYSLSFAPAPKMDLRLSFWYDVTTQIARGDFGVRLYF